MNSNFNDNLKSTRHGFTLVEMLFVVAIIAVLGTMTAGILAKAQNDAKIAATRSRITQIEAIMQTVNEDFEVRRMPFRNSQLAGLFPADRNRRMRVRNLRRQVAAAMLQAEFPGLLPLLDGSGGFSPNQSAGKLIPEGVSYDPDLIAALGLVTTPTAEMEFWQNQSMFDQPGEYLYLILERINIDGSSALESLGPNVVGDTDDDGIPEIVDAFGDSMQLRIVQVADVTSEQTNWKQLVDIGDGIKIPLGYEFLDPSKPRSINQIRFQIVSPNLEAIE